MDITTPEENKLSDVTRQLEDKRQTVISVDADLARLQGYIRVAQSDIVSLNKQKADIEPIVSSLQDTNARLKMENAELANLVDEKSKKAVDLDNEYSIKTVAMGEMEQKLKDKEDSLIGRENAVLEKESILKTKILAFNASQESFNNKVAKLTAVIAEM